MWSIQLGVHLKRMMNGRQHSKPITTILNMLWCHLTLLTHWLFSNIWCMMSFMNTWMISWSITLMTFSFSQRTWKTMNIVYNLRKLDLMPNWSSVNFINLKWNYWVTSFLDMASTRILIRFRPLLIRLF